VPRENTNPHTPTNGVRGPVVLSGPNSVPTSGPRTPKGPERALFSLFHINQVSNHQPRRADPTHRWEWSSRRDGPTTRTPRWCPVDRRPTGDDPR